MAAAIPRFEEWIEEPRVLELSRTLAEPAPVTLRRKEAFEAFLRLPLEPDPLYRQYGYFAGVDLSGVDPMASGRPVAVPHAEPDVVSVVHDIAGTHPSVPSELASAGVTLRTLPQLWQGGDAAIQSFLPGREQATDRLTALAFAVLNRGYELTIPDGFRDLVRLRDLTILSGPHDALSIRRVLRVGRGASALVTEEVYSTSNEPRQRLLASSVDLEVGEDARVAYLGVHAPDPKAVSLYQRRAVLGAGSRIRWVWNGFGGFRTKARNLTTMLGNRSDTEDLQTFYGDANQSYDSAVHLTHLGTDTHGQSITRGVFRDDSRGMSRGLVRIEKEARKTISYISEHAMLLSRGARSDTIPILEILNRDVKATHSTSVAPVDPEKVFYLEARGISEVDAVRMIGEGFLAHVLERAPVKDLRETLFPMLTARWERKPILWDAAGSPALPRLELATGESGRDWRFDSKLL